ncbi:hypothetical protein QRX50_09585 [Amycolatopsis carbonis]|uniref:Uncharacterized protein n=1 Tax=Amycolatopsis carbonis TaxID=715471 RepID=A0A9Y2IJB1_9PSEU|nr:hypothetical protein [Amycolatopsis sp. 2-15]WIX80984.1 hypothetical protein QRX50_09585 [Amycolatopsis sp. 2-15]
MAVYDVDSMAIAARQVEKLKDEYQKSKDKLTGMDHEKESPFGGMPGSQDAHSAVGEFKNGVHSQFDAAGQHMDALASAMRKAAGLMTEMDEVGKSDLTVHVDK